MTSWSPKSPIPEPRSHCPAAVWNGKIYLFGGGGVNFQSLQSVAIYDPKTDQWASGREMPTLRSGTVAATLGDRIYVMGGGFKQADGKFVFYRTVEIYDPENDSWSQGPDLLMPHDYPAVTVYNDAIYVMGGHHPDATEAGPLTDPGFAFCERLDPVRGVWIRIPPLEIPRFAAAAVTYQDRIFVLGGAGYRPEGFTNFNLGESYDIRKGRWRSQERVTLPWRAAGLGACLIGERVVIAGGFDGEAVQRGAAAWDPALGRWEALEPIPEPRMAMATVVVGETLYLFGGRGEDRKTPVQTVWAYPFG